MKIVCTGRGASLSNIPKIRAQVFELAKTKTPTILYLGTPSYDKESIFDIQTKGFKDAGCEIVRLDLSEVPIGESPIIYPSYDEIEAQMSRADVIQVSGGNTLYAIHRWQELGVDLILKDLASRGNDGPVFCGGSAGAICWFAEGVSDSLNPETLLNPDPSLTDEEKKNWDYIRIPGLDILKGLCVPHYDIIQHNGLFRATASERFVKELPNVACIGIDEDAALVVNGEDVTVIEGTPGKTCYRKIFDAVTSMIEVMVLEEGKVYDVQSLGLM